jgi:hypothetical protein
MSSRNWLTMSEPPGNTSRLADLDLPALPQRVRGATLTPEYQAELDEPIPYVPVDVAPRRPSSSQAGLTAIRFSHSAPGSVASSIVQLDALEQLAEKAIIWADTDPDNDEGLNTERDLLAAITAYKAVAR